MFFDAKYEFTRGARSSEVRVALVSRRWKLALLGLHDNIIRATACFLKNIEKKKLIHSPFVRCILRNVYLGELK